MTSFARFRYSKTFLKNSKRSKIGQKAFSDFFQMFYKIKIEQNLSGGQIQSILYYCLLKIWVRKNRKVLIFLILGTDLKQGR